MHIIWHSDENHEGQFLGSTRDTVVVGLYRSSLPTMTPMTKNTTHKARALVLGPSSFRAEPGADGEKGLGAADIDVAFLIRRPSSSCVDRKPVLINGQHGPQYSKPG